MEYLLLSLLSCDLTAIILQLTNQTKYQWVYYIVICLCYLFWYFFYKQTTKVLPILLIDVSFIGVFFLLFKQRVIWDLTPAVQNYIAHFNDYYNTSLTWGDAHFPDSPFLGSFPVLFFWFILSGVFAYFIVEKKNLFLVLLFSIPVFALPPLVGLRNNLFTSVVFAVCILFLLFWNKSNHTPRECIIFTVLFVTIFTACFALTNRYLPQIQSTNNHFYGVQTKLENLFGMNHIFSENGDLSNTAPQYSGTKLMEITTNDTRIDTIYLKGFVGKDYSNGKWSAAGDRSFNKSINASTKDLPYHSLSSLPYKFTNKYISQTFGRNIIEEQYKLKIKLINAPGNTSYCPYFADFTEDSLKKALTENGDGAMINTKEKDLSFTCNKYFYIPEDSYTNRIENDYNAAYKKYVYKNYLSTPKNQKRLKKAAKNLASDHLDTTITNVIQYLRIQADYDLKLDKLPSNEDYVNYFLYTQKKGFCTHFASAATLLFRYMGIPARYVTGYSIPSSSLKQVDYYNYKADVLDKNGHAWCEIYLDDIGWIPVDATPGYSNANSSTMNSNQEDVENALNEEEPTTQEQDDTQEQEVTTEAPEEDEDATTQEQKNSNTEDENSVKNVVKNFSLFPFVTPILIIILILVLLLLHRIFILNHYRNHSYERLYELLCFCGYKKSTTQSDQQYAVWVQEQLDFLKENELLTFIQILEETLYAKQPLKKKEQQTLLLLYRKILIGLYQSQPFYKKFLMKFLKCYI